MFLLDMDTTKQKLNTSQNPLKRHYTANGMQIRFSFHFIQKKIT